MQKRLLTILLALALMLVPFQAFALEDNLPASCTGDNSSDSNCLLAICNQLQCKPGQGIYFSDFCKIADLCTANSDCQPQQKAVNAECSTQQKTAFTDCQPQQKAAACSAPIFNQLSKLTLSNQNKQQNCKNIFALLNSLCKQGNNCITITNNTPEAAEKPAETPAKPEKPVSETPAESEKPVAEKPAETPVVIEKPAAESDAFVTEVVRLVNAERAKYGLAPLKMQESLNAAAAVRAKEATEVFSHTRPNGTSCFTVLKEFGIKYSYAGENIALGQTTAAQVMNDWMNSDGHRKNILSPNFTAIGVGKSGKGWAQLFIG